VVGVGCLLSTFILVLVSGVASASAPSVALTPLPKSGAYENNQTITVAVGPNSLFHPGARIVIIECADPGGDAAHLPVSFDTCDENTVQGDTVSVATNGSFSEPSYSIYSTPNSAFGEPADWQPICNATNQCVLYVGENQNDFTQPKLFSVPFAVSGTAASAAAPASVATTATTVTVGRASSTQPTSTVSAKVSLPAETLAFTGMSPWVALVALLGALLLVASTVVWLLARRRTS
jgi:hypothetical protein